MNGYTGGLLEEEALGRCKASANGYKPFKEALSLVKENQPWDLTPKPHFARTLRKEVAEVLGLECRSDLRFYTAVGSALDVYHGIDAVIEWQGFIVTLDVTMRLDKEYKADLLVVPNDIMRDDQRQKLAAAIAGELSYRRQEAAARQLAPRPVFRHQRIGAK